MENNPNFYQGINIREPVKEGPAYFFKGLCKKIFPSIALAVSVGIFSIGAFSYVSSGRALSNKIGSAPLVPVPAVAQVEKPNDCYIKEKISENNAWFAYLDSLKKDNPNLSLKNFPTHFKVRDVNMDGRVCGVKY